jgi:pimeloyl-ACP methyl ester carboxylesterase
VLESLLALTSLLLRHPESVLHRIPIAPAETLAVTVSGSGRPVVLIPGLFGSAFGYRHIIAGLSERGYRSIVIEPLGVGASSRPEGADYSFSAQADRVAAVLRTLELEQPAVVVAHSVSATIGFRMALRHPEQVAALISIEGGLLERAATPSLRAVADAGPLLRFGGEGMIRRAVYRGLRDASANPEWITPAVLEEYTSWAAGDLRGALAAYKAMVRAKDAEPLAPGLVGLRCEVWLVLGGASHRSGPSPREVTAMKELIPHLRSEVVTGAGHHIHEEQPAALVTIIDEAVRSTARSELSSGT